MENVKKKVSYTAPQAETVKIQMEQCIASPNQVLQDLAINDILDEDV